MDKFNLTDDDYFAIEIAKKVARNFLTNPRITPQQVIGIGSALYALERMPEVTQGSSSEFGICYRGVEDSKEMKYIDFKISECAFEISIGGSVYNEVIGSDSFPEPGWTVEIGGYRKTECDLHSLESDIVEYLNLGAEINVSDESEIGYENT